MSYMGAYVMWLEEEGLTGMEHVERYHKENPHMIPPEGERVISTFPKARVESDMEYAQRLVEDNEDN